MIIKKTFFARYTVYDFLLPPPCHIRYTLNYYYLIGNYLFEFVAHLSTFQTRDPWATSLIWEKKFKSINTHGYIILMRIKWFFIWKKKLNLLHPRMLCDKCSWNWPSGSGEEDFGISSMHFRYFVIICPWKYCEALNMNKLQSPSARDALCHVWLKLAQWFWRKRFLNFINLFSHFREGSIIWINLKSLHPGILCAQFAWSWPSGSGKEDLFNFVSVFLLFRNYLPLEKGGALHLNKLESSSPKDALCQVWFKLAQSFWRRWKCEVYDNVNNNDNDDNEKDWQRTNFDQKISLEPLAQVS